MSPTSYTERTAPAPAWTHDIRANFQVQATILFGIVMPIVDGVAYIDPTTTYSERTAAAPSTTERTAPAPSMTERSL